MKLNEIIAKKREKSAKNEIFQLNDKKNILFTTFYPDTHITITFSKYEAIKQPSWQETEETMKTEKVQWSFMNQTQS